MVIDPDKPANRAQAVIAEAFNTGRSIIVDNLGTPQATATNRRVIRVED